jgi:hypothetical protein
VWQHIYKFRLLRMLSVGIYDNYIFCVRIRNGSQSEGERLVQRVDWRWPLSLLIFWVKQCMHIFTYKYIHTYIKFTHSISLQPVSMVHSSTSLLAIWTRTILTQQTCLTSMLIIPRLDAEDWLLHHSFASSSSSSTTTTSTCLGN